MSPRRNAVKAYVTPSLDLSRRESWQTGARAVIRPGWIRRTLRRGKTLPKPKREMHSSRPIAERNIGSQETAKNTRFGEYGSAPMRRIRPALVFIEAKEWLSPGDKNTPQMIGTGRRWLVVRSVGREAPRSEWLGGIAAGRSFSHLEWMPR